MFNMFKIRTCRDTKNTDMSVIYVCQVNHEYANKRNRFCRNTKEKEGFQDLQGMPNS